MSDFWLSIFFGLGVSGIVYGKMQRRLGAGNGKALWIIIGVAFLLTVSFFYSLLALVLNIH
jgi:hypothetical protein